MKQIPLTQGKFVTVDDEDFEYLNQWKWRYDNGYAVRTSSKLFKRTTILMHRVIMNPPHGMFIDHINPSETLNNRRSNLRICTNKENVRNMKTPKTNTTGYKGVSTSGSKWRASIRVDDKRIYLGTFSTSEDAAKAYDNAALLYYGEYAQTNF